MSKTVACVLDMPEWRRERWAHMRRSFAPGDGRKRSRAALLAAVLVVAACGRDTTGPSGGGDVELAPGEYALFSGAQVGGALDFPAAAGSGALYLVVAQAATGSSGVSSAFSLTGVAGAAAARAAPPPAPSLLGGERPAALRFHDGIRAWDARLAAEARARGARAAAPAGRPVRSPPVVGSSRTFKVCADLDCATLKNVIATARVVGTHAAIFLDDSAPAGGFTDQDLQALGRQFDSELYPIDRGSFGAESDVDGNGVVVILLTPKVNALVGRSECITSFVTGYFLGADLAPEVRLLYNNGEVFYGLVPDPAGVASCPATAEQVRRLIPVTFIHEFQHMISFNQHVLVRNGDTEVLWLNEALSHLAEELGGRYYDSLHVTATASQFYIGNLYNAYQYLIDPAASAMVTEEPPGELAERGAEWLFVRYLMDRFGSRVPQSLVNTSAHGAANVAAATGTSFATLVGQWALATYASDLPGFTAPAELRYQSWRFRTTFASLNVEAPSDFAVPFPLVPASAAGGAVAVTGRLKSGSGAYLLVTQQSGGAAFSLTLTPSGGGGFASNVGAQIAVLRLR